ncbi:hypothetical protein RvY_08900 [Ramazzottius varieornatus]|uniref:Uncharacterized protein n=1 Tax=Ramazzottius varieornatus TaxID=947166 RepID=A0A1D1V7I7_RAMVA|nr:hypothetical protein RvY_08900 [Ramazzottius varieornatus]
MFDLFFRFLCSTSSSTPSSFAENTGPLKDWTTCNWSFISRHCLENLGKVLWNRKWVSSYLRMQWTMLVRKLDILPILPHPLQQFRCKVRDDHIGTRTSHSMKYLQDS